MRNQTKIVRLIGTVLVAAGALLAIAGGATWLTVRSQLVAENITIPEDAMAFQGNRVDGPIDAFIQADIINHHALEATDGKTYAELEQDDPLRAVVQTGSFLRASLFTSVIAFGMAAFAAGLGVLFAATGVALRKLDPATAKAVEVPLAATERDLVTA